MTAVLRVGLREHHQFNIAGVALEFFEAIDQVVNLILGQRQAQLGIRRHQSLAPTGKHVYALHRFGGMLTKQLRGGGHRV